MRRELTERERWLIQRIAERLDDLAAEQLSADAALATAEDGGDHGSLVEFTIADYQRPSSGIQASYGVEGKMLDEDGEELHLDLFADINGRLFILEFFRREGGPPKNPNWDTWSFY